MLQKDYPVILPDYILTQEEFSPENCLFFDIETTGLSWKTSHLYLLGAVFYENGTWIHRQWFCQKPIEEKDVLLAFSELLSTRKLLLHYNGTTFDVPYLMHKYTFYQLPSPWEGTRQMDLYQLFSPLKQLLHLDHMRQKDLEQAIGLFRKDRYSGGKLIEVYKKYLLSGDEDLLEILRLHNKEDVDGMLHLLPLFSIRALWTGNCQEFITCNHTPENNLILSVQPKYPFPVRFEKELPHAVLHVTPDQLRLEIHPEAGCKKFFYPNYKDYYYLPMEDEAIHKSVGAYVDKDHREKATADNCYKKVSGCFYPQYEDLFTPAFRDERKEKNSWFLLLGDFDEDQEQLLKYLNHLLSHVLQ